MALYLPVQCPTFFEELRRRLRGGRGQIVLLVYALILVLILLLVTQFNEVSTDPQSWPSYGRTLWSIFYIAQLLVVVLISPGLTAGAICAEREQETLELLLLTRMSSVSVVLGKFLGAIGQMLLVIISGLPIISVVFFFGGVSPAEVLKGYALIIATGICYAGMGFFASCLLKKMSSAVAMAYGFMIILLIGLPILMGVLLQDMLSIGSGDLFYYSTLQNPFITAVISLQDPTASSGMHASVWASIAELLVITVLVLAECMMMVRRMRGLSKRFIPKTLAQPVRASVREQAETH
jgi:ABC-type transport system involved in multi-copper enzyme maturation permease subunit